MLSLIHPQTNICTHILSMCCSPTRETGLGEEGKGNEAEKGRVKKRKLTAPRLALDATDEGVVVESEEAGQSGKDKMEFEEHKGSDEDMSDRWLVFALSCLHSSSSFFLLREIERAVEVCLIRFLHA